MPITEEFIVKKGDLEKDMRKMDKDNYRKFKYRCGWCKHEFTRIIGFIDNEDEARGMLGKTKKLHSNVSDQVTCPRCKQMIPTWTECVEGVKRHGFRGLGTNKKPGG